jgi:hypothetical protein
MDRKLLLRQQMRQSMEDEIAARTKAHQEKVARFKSAVHARKAIGAEAPATPLVLLSHGDSWFDYPLDGNNISLMPTDVIVQLGSMGNITPYILNISPMGRRHSGRNVLA